MPDGSITLAKAGGGGGREEEKEISVKTTTRFDLAASLSYHRVGDDPGSRHSAFTPGALTLFHYLGPRCYNSGAPRATASCQSDVIDSRSCRGGANWSGALLMVWIQDR